ncbi:amidohydrolase family protein [Coriobacteriaceae bacterium BV3Ac1]|nr:amidohydrolase family protein [Coriobacteriaceae bacterium BV3Ac1]
MIFMAKYSSSHTKRAYVNGVILDGTKDMCAQKGKAVLVEGDTIVGISEQISDLSGYEIIDLDGRYLLPGLINMHVHLAGNGKPQKKQRDASELVDKLFSNPISAAIAHALVRSYAKIELMSGVTTIRTVGGLRDLDTRVRDEIACGNQLGPRIIAANEGISVPGGHMAGSVAIAAESSNAACALVHKAQAQNVDLIKLMITGGVLDAKAKGVPGELKMPPEMVKAACDEAHACGYLVAAHVESTEGVKVALENGVDSIEHGAEPTDEIIQLFKDRGAFLTCTISPALSYALFDRSISGASEIEQFNGKMVFDGIISCAKAALAHDIPVALGNDVGCPWVSQYDFWRELVYFHKMVGVSEKFTLYTATLRNAELAGIGDKTGSIEVGKCADMIVCSKNPLEDLSALRDIDMIVTQGYLVKHPHVMRKKILDRELDKFL